MSVQNSPSRGFLSSLPEVSSWLGLQRREQTCVLPPALRRGSNLLPSWRRAPREATDSSGSGTNLLFPLRPRRPASLGLGLPFGSEAGGASAATLSPKLMARCGCTPGMGRAAVAGTTPQTPPSFTLSRAAKKRQQKVYPKTDTTPPPPPPQPSSPNPDMLHG